MGHSSKPNFKDVKSAFERNYGCMGITCQEVGGLYDSVKRDYFPGTNPCADSHGNQKAEGPNIGLPIGLSVLGMFAMLLVVLIAGCLGPKPATVQTEPSEGEVA